MLPLHLVYQLVLQGTRCGRFAMVVAARQDAGSFTQNVVVQHLRNSGVTGFDGVGEAVAACRGSREPR